MLRKILIAAIIVLLTLVATETTGLAGEGSSEQPAPIRLKSITIPPDQLPELPADLTIDHFPPGAEGYYIVQFRGPIKEHWRRQLLDNDVEILEYLPDFAYKVRMKPRLLAEVRGVTGVTRVLIFQPAYKLSPDLSQTGRSQVIIKTERGIPAQKIAEAVLATGASIARYDGDVLRVMADSDAITAIARIPDVAWIEPFRMVEKHNEYGGGIIMGGNKANDRGYDGSTQVVAIADTGLGAGTPQTAHPDLAPERIKAIFDWPADDAPGCWQARPDGPGDPDSGHGTHTTISIAGAGGTEGEGKGMAPAATVIMQAVGDFLDMSGQCATRFADGYYLMGLPADLHALYRQAYDADARVHADPWGSEAAGDYTTDAAITDDFMWTHPDMLIAFSAGNAGRDANADGVVDDNSISSPATAKNVLSVGASENRREDGYPCDKKLDYGNCAESSGKNAIFTYGDTWPDAFPADPVASDLITGNSQQMAAFSGRGPSDDGRIKPDVVAPGTYVLSGYSDLYQQGYDAKPNSRDGVWQYDGWGYPFSDRYKYMGGTSMADALAAGAAVLVRDFYQKTYQHHASAALVKATLINSAVDLQDENNDGVNDNAFPIPNMIEGWGRIDVATATDGTSFFMDRGRALITGQDQEVTAIVSKKNRLKITLVWTDFPASPAARTALVNDLDLVVISPDGETYLGNVFKNGWSVPGGTADRLNNVENVFVRTATPGAWTIQVRAHNVPMGPQYFALVIDGASDLQLSAETDEVMHIGDIDGSSHWLNDNGRWLAAATVTVMNSQSEGVARALVRGVWSNHKNMELTCTTDSSGVCIFNSQPLDAGSEFAVFRVIDVLHDRLGYQPDENNDADRDSDGEAIRINRPPR